MLPIASMQNHILLVNNDAKIDAICKYLGHEYGVLHLQARYKVYWNGYVSHSKYFALSFVKKDHTD